MKLDSEYISKMISPLKDSIGLKPSEYFRLLSSEGISAEDANGIIDEKFKRHFLYLIENNFVTNNHGSKELSGFGISIAPNGHLLHWDANHIIQLAKNIIHQ